MGKGQKKYSAVEVLEIIDKYFYMKRALGLHVESPYSYSVTADYDNLGMPRGNGVGDPTFRQAFSGVYDILSEPIANEFKRKIRFIDERISFIRKHREMTVLHWKLSGLKTKHIAELEGITERHVRRILKEISEKMSEMSVMSEMSNVS